jgi:hypothetical protein
MTENANILLRDARPDDRIHLLVWDTPDENELLRIPLYTPTLRKSENGARYQEPRTINHYQKYPGCMVV